jgi:hypothetical protein
MDIGTRLTPPRAGIDALIAAATGGAAGTGRRSSPTAPSSPATQALTSEES